MTKQYGQPTPRVRVNVSGRSHGKSTLKGTRPSDLTPTDIGDELEGGVCTFNTTAQSYQTTRYSLCRDSDDVILCFNVGAFSTQSGHDRCVDLLKSVEQLNIRAGSIVATSLFPDLREHDPVNLTEGTFVNGVLGLNGLRTGHTGDFRCHEHGLRRATDGTCPVCESNHHP